MKHGWNTALALAGSVVLLSAAVPACTGDVGGSELDIIGQGAGISNGNGSDSSGVGGNFGQGGGSSSGGDDSCAEVVAKADPIGVSMFIAVDKSGSMGSNNKWNDAKAAFISFFTAPEADLLNVALRFWPDGGCDTSCNVSACAQAQVPLGSLADPAHEQALIDAFNSRSPGGLTPMEAALAGAEQYALAFQSAAEAGERMVVVLLTDGEPTACNENINVIAQYAADAYAQGEILTFAVGLQGSNESQMNTIAQAGQTGAGYFIGSGNAQADLLQALKDIQQIAVACSFAMPESDDPTKPVDPKQVNVIYKSGPNDPGTPIPQVPDEASCTDAGGWYYDDPADPAIILMCPATCDIANANPDSELLLELGCLTVVQ